MTDTRGAPGTHLDTTSVPTYEFAKRGFDILVSAAGLVVLAPVFLVVGLVIRLSSSGPMFYRGERVGLNGRRFRIWKFRTMRPDAEAEGTTTRLRDPRITHAGRALRKYKIDEIPQLINVLVGDMSLVGPRPEVSEHTDAYTDEELCILSVRPGITDYSSIRFASLDEELGDSNPHAEYLARVRPQKNALRVQYVRRRSFLEDLRILTNTLRVLAQKARR